MTVLSGIKELNLRYHWSVMQVESATDIVSKKQESLQRIYSKLVATAIYTDKAENIATFFGHKLDPGLKEKLATITRYALKAAA